MKITKNNISLGCLDPNTLRQIFFQKSHVLQSTGNKFACSFHFSPATVTAEGRVISNKWGQGNGGRSRLKENMKMIMRMIRLSSYTAVQAKVGPWSVWVRGG